jgi:hypothetical protein
MLRKVFLLTLLGFLTVVFIGPILAAAATALSFAFVGLLIWLPLHALARGRHSIAWRSLARVGPPLARVGSTLRSAGTVCLEIASGAAIGALIVFLSNLEQAPAAGTVLAGAGLGAGVGVLVTLSRLRSGAPAGLGHAAEEYSS